MSGLGRKVFTAGEILKASDVQGFLMDQTAMVFADAAARDTAIPTPTEGMLTYLLDISDYEYRDETGNWVALVPDVALLTANQALITDGAGNIATSTVTSTELAHVGGVTSALQTQLNGKSPLAGSTSITTVGTVTTATSPTNAGSNGLRKITISTADPTGGANGDVWLKFEA